MKNIPKMPKLSGRPNHWKTHIYDYPSLGLHLERFNSIINRAQRIQNR